MTGYEAMEHAQTVCTRLFSVKSLGTSTRLVVTKQWVAHVTKQLKYRTITENTHPAFVWSLRRTVSSCRIAILHLPDNYNRRVGLQTSVGGARKHCMHA